MSGGGRHTGVWLAVTLALLWAAGIASAESSHPSEWPGLSGTEEGGGSPADHYLTLGLGEVRSIPVQRLERVAIANPAVADVEILSGQEILVQAKAPGSTNLILWDTRGQHRTSITVSDAAPAHLEADLRALVERLNLPDVNVTREKNKLFLIGQVPSQEEWDRIEQMLTAFPGVTNLVRVPPPLVEAEKVPPLIELGVQVLELSRKDIDELGINWTDSLDITESATADLTGHDAFKLGTIGRSTLTAGLTAMLSKNRVRLLAEPKLVTQSGKQASSFIGVEVPIPTATSFDVGGDSVSVSIDFRETGVKLTLTPTIIPAAEGGVLQIATVVDAEVSDIDESVGLNVPVGAQTILVPGFGVRRTNTEVTTVPGETIIIAGLLKAREEHTVDSVPGLGSVPVFGRLFRSPKLEDTQQEVVITVTPTLVEDEAERAGRRQALDRALSVAEVAASVDDPRLRYSLQIQERIAKVLRYPQRERELKIAGTVKLRLHVFADGTLGRALISQSAGVEALDAEALKAAESQSPYPRFPEQIRDRELWIEIPVIFRP